MDRMNSVCCFDIKAAAIYSVRKQEAEFPEATLCAIFRNTKPPRQPAKETLMIPLLSLHAIAAQRGDGLHPVLLAGLQRLATERVECTTAETGREHGARIAEPTADNVTRKETVKSQRAA
jgi:hypothetical protein